METTQPSPFELVEYLDYVPLTEVLPTAKLVKQFVSMNEAITTLFTMKHGFIRVPLVGVQLVILLANNQVKIFTSNPKVAFVLNASGFNVHMRKGYTQYIWNVYSIEDPANLPVTELQHGRSSN